MNLTVREALVWYSKVAGLGFSGACVVTLIFDRSISKEQIATFAFVTTMWPITVPAVTVFHAYQYWHDCKLNFTLKVTKTRVTKEKQ